MQFSRLVTPPRPLCRRWWTSQAAAGWWQPPAHWQNLSRSLTALRIAAGTSSLYPTSQGRLGPAGGLVAAAGPLAELVPQLDRVADRGRDIIAVPDIQGKARAGQAGAELLAAQEAGQPAWARDQGDSLADDGALESLAAEPGRGGQQDLKGLRGTGVQGSRVGGGRGRGGRSGVTGVAGSGGVKRAGGGGGVGAAVAVAVPS